MDYPTDIWKGQRREGTEGKKGKTRARKKHDPIIYVTNKITWKRIRMSLSDLSSDPTSVGAQWSFDRWRNPLFPEETTGRSVDEPYFFFGGTLLRFFFFCCSFALVLFCSCVLVLLLLCCSCALVLLCFVALLLLLLCFSVSLLL